MNFLLSKCAFFPLTENVLAECNPFECNNPDLNDFFQNDCIKYSNELLGKTYCFTLNESPETIVCMFTISNDSIKTTNLPGSRKKKVTSELPQPKSNFRSYPAVLIGRLGVNKDFKKQGIGTQLMDFIKAWFVDGTNKTGCRYVVVDSYNNEEATGYYVKNGFTFLFSTEQQEKEFYKIDSQEPLKTRLMFFDLIVLRNS